jgi:hypothetical protein
MAQGPLNNFNHLASPSQAIGQARKMMNPLTEYKQIMDRSQLVDPLGTRQMMDQARRVMNPLGEYQRIMSDFSRLVGAPSLTTTAEGSEHSAPSSTSPAPFSLGPSHILALLSAAWACAWLIAGGVDAQELGDLLFEAAGLAIYVYEKSKQNPD